MAAAKKTIEPLLSIEEIQELTGLSRPSIDRAKKDGGLPWYKIGSRVKFRQSEVEKWITERKQK